LGSLEADQVNHRCANTGPGPSSLRNDNRLKSSIISSQKAYDEPPSPSQRSQRLQQRRSFIYLSPLRLHTDEARQIPTDIIKLPRVARPNQRNRTAGCRVAWIANGREMPPSPSPSVSRPRSPVSSDARGFCFSSPAIGRLMAQPEPGIHAILAGGEGQPWRKAGNSRPSLRLT
jgi:hypothetical protein